MRDWLLAFVLTLAVELPLYALALRRKGWRYALLVGLGLNVLTHPLAWFFITSRGGFMPVEIAVWLVEGLGVFTAARTRWSKDRADLVQALATSLAANAASAGLGLLL